MFTKDTNANFCTAYGAYGTTEKKLLWNFNYNKKHYQEGKHYFVVEGDELKQILAVVNFTNAKQVRQLYIWTEKGAFLHAKSLNTQKA